MNAADALKRHWGARSAGYDRFVVKGFADIAERRSWQNLYRGALGDRYGNVLDTGCGPGIVSMQLKDARYNVTGLDFSEEMLSLARKNARENDLDIEFVHGDAMDLPFADRSFGAVVSDYMLWTVPDPEKVIFEWYRVLGPGGRLVYVDGGWCHDPKSTATRCAVSRIARHLDDPHRGKFRDNDGGVMESLWSFSANRPTADVEMLSRAGFRNVRVRHGIQREVLHGMRYLAHGLTNDHFMITADKPEDAA